MQKVYLLLRNNRQSGPYTIGELLQQQLLPTDMVWIEGRSTAWAYVSELELQPPVSAPEPKPAKGGRRMDEIEEKAEALRLRALSYSPPRFVQDHTEVVRHIPIPESQVPEEEIAFVDHRTDKHSVFNEVLMTILIVGLLFGGLYGGRTLFMARQSDERAAAPTRIVSSDQHAAARVLSPQPLPAAAVDSTLTDSTALALTEAPRPAVIRKSTALATLPADTGLTDRVAVSDAKKDDRVALPPVVTDPNAGQETQKADAAAEKKDSVVQEQEPAVEKHKGLGQALKGLFKKKKKEERAAEDSTRQGE